MRRFMAYFNALLLGMILGMIFLALVHDCSAEFSGHLVNHGEWALGLRELQHDHSGRTATARIVRSPGCVRCRQLLERDYWNWNQFKLAIPLPPLKTM